jgi:ATP-dependent DNA ligase
MREVKFDGWRGQLHKHGDEVVVFSRNGKDFAKRFLAIRDSVLSPAAIDGEVVWTTMASRTSERSWPVSARAYAPGASTSWSS